MVDAFAAAVTAGDDVRVLDAGCGAGRMSRYLADRGCLVEGVDLSSGMVAMARRDHPDPVFDVDHLAAAGLREVCRLVRRAQATERDDQAFLIARRDPRPGSG
jgi:predicted TPR repeat methyltransferase